jgi:hypothetical protein
MVVPRCGALNYLRLKDWPTVHIWNGDLHAIEVINLGSGQIISRLRLHDDGVFEATDPKLDESPTVTQKQFLTLQMSSGRVVAANGEMAYYLPKKEGFVRKINLTASPPVVVRRASERQSSLYPRVSAVSESTGTVWVQVAHLSPGGANYLPSNTARILDTSNVNPIADLRLGIADCDCMAAS